MGTLAACRNWDWRVQCGVRACPDCGRGSCGHPGVPGAGHGSGDDVLKRLGVKGGRLGLSSRVGWERWWRGQGGWQRGYLCPPTAVHQDPTGGSRAPYPVGPVAEGHSPQDPLVSHVLTKAGERPGARMADSQEHGSL